MALGMESGKISDDQIKASSSFYDNRWSPRQARLNNYDNAWTPSEDSNKEFIQVFICFLHFDIFQISRIFFVESLENTVNLRRRL